MVGRAPRIFIEGGVYHVYNRVARGMRVFGDDDEAERFVGLLREVRDRDGQTIFAWCLMGSHYHLALRQGAVPLARSMKTVQNRFTRNYNARHKEFGPLWQSRYKAKRVDNPGYLHQLLAYVHLNPVVAGLVNDPADYEWVGHRELIKATYDPVIDVDQVLMLFGKTKVAARKAYVRGLRGIRDAEWLGEGPGRLPWWRLGRPPKEEDEDLKPEAPSAFVDELGRSTGLERQRLTVEEFVRLASTHLGVELDVLRGRARARDAVEARELLVTLGAERYGLKVKELTIVLGKSVQAGSEYVSRGIRRRQEDEGFRKRFEALDRKIAKGTDSE
ncbi:MAG: hypothetical protein GY906_29435 [bacterium]|nr:hypothetical protein [bacterium]